MTPAFILRMRQGHQNQRERADVEELAYLRRENSRLMNDVTRYINENNRLWGELKKLPGGLEAARRVPR